ncbi:hypothetical protein ARMSODRAFT_1087024 [Armillaria solidipes]|uniref:Uncharacterized protein n=1 Tax=Armillaria solidipes TaxID=1076256 RepID=A0A2H3BSX8_9AGAR|nr:hypothetical protein ARMSODRAFT_1087024 [Armillaria solidipes]
MNSRDTSSGLLEETMNGVCPFPGVSVYCCLTTTRRMDEKKQKYVRGCIVGPDIAVLSLAIVKQGEAGKYLAVSRSKAGNEMFNLSKEDDVRKYVVRREVKSGKENAKPYMGPAVPYWDLVPVTTPTPRLPRSNVSLLPSVSCAVVTFAPSSAEIGAPEGAEI